MRLSSILNSIATIPPEADITVTRLIQDSREVKPGDIFIALSGTKTKGSQFIPEVIQKKAAAVLLDEEGHIAWQQSIPIIPIKNLRAHLGKIAAEFYGHPASRMKMFGVTGTNGKTSCTHFLAQALQSFNLSCGVMGTLGNGLYGALGEPGLTTPDALTLHATLKQFLAQGAKATAMEVSSHSIDQGRVNGIAFEAGIFTNLTQDHLDYHHTMAAYAAVKKRFFTEFSQKHIILNGDDAYGKQWLSELTNHPSVFAYGLKRMDLPASIPQIYADKIRLTLHGITAQIYTPWGNETLSLPLVGAFNLSNVLAVLTALCVQELPFADVMRTLSHLKPVPGRMTLLGGKGQPLVAVDYSHTPDSLEKALQALRAHAGGKVICVFGCGGNRDAAKRPLMAGIAERLADQVIVTNDNPRHEDPADIAQQIIKGFQAPEAVSVILDRSKAIEKSIQCASANDCILIAGKGAEHYQQVGDVKLPFDDAAEVRRYLNQTVNELHGDH